MFKVIDKSDNRCNCMHMSVTRCISVVYRLFMDPDAQFLRDSVNNNKILPNIQPLIAAPIFTAIKPVRKLDFKLGFNWDL